jgi:hypothetical protein
MCVLPVPGSDLAGKMSFEKSSCTSLLTQAQHSKTTQTRNSAVLKGAEIYKLTLIYCRESSKPFLPVCYSGIVKVLRVKEL